MTILQEIDHILVIPENWLEAFKLSKNNNLHCRVCGLEGCKPHKHKEYDSVENERSMGGNDL